MMAKFLFACHWIDNGCTTRHIVSRRNPKGAKLTRANKMITKAIENAKLTNMGWLNAKLTRAEGEYRPPCDVLLECAII